MLHLIKLCVGVDTLEELACWQAKRVTALKKKRAKPELVHVTRQTPKRASELLDIRGYIAARQRLIDVRPARAKDGVPRCGLVYEPKLVPTVRRVRDPFQGWRYLDPKDAPPDVKSVQRAIGLPASLCAELAELGLL
jgi:hypothetical protein